MAPRGSEVYYEFEDVPPERLRFCSNGTRCAAFWVSQHQLDGYDEDTKFAIAVWETMTGILLESHSRTHSIAHDTGAVTGKRVKDLDFNQGFELLILFEDGTVEKASAALPSRAQASGW